MCSVKPINLNLTQRDNNTMAIASGSTSRRAPASGRPGGPLAASQRSQAVRMNLFVLVRILFQYLERVDKSVLDLAREVLKDCERKHNTKDSKYETLADAISERVRDAVGENHWMKAREIQKQLAANQQKKRYKAIQIQKWKQRSQQQPRTVSQEQSSVKDESMDVAMTLSSMSQKASPSPAASTNSSNLYSASKTLDQEMATNCPARRPEPGKSSLTIKEDSSILRDGASGASSGQLPLRKRIMFATPPESTASSTTSDSSFSFTKMRR